jgi:hypothetical protein
MSSGLGADGYHIAFTGIREGKKEKGNEKGSPLLVFRLMSRRHSYTWRQSLKFWNDSE